MEALAVLGAVLGLALLIPLTAILRGWVLTILWGWFVVPTFDMPQLTLAPAIGIALVVSYLTHQISSGKKDDRAASDQIGKMIVHAIVGPLFTLLFGWVVHLFM